MNHTRTQPSTSSRESVEGEKGFVLGFHGVRYHVKDQLEDPDDNAIELFEPARPEAR